MFCSVFDRNSFRYLLTTNWKKGKKSTTKAKKKKKKTKGRRWKCSQMTFTVVCGLKKVLKPGKNRKRVLKKIREPVETVSKCIKLGSLHLHYESYDLVFNGRRANNKNEFNRKLIDSKYILQPDEKNKQGNKIPNSTWFVRVFGRLWGWNSNGWIQHAMPHVLCPRLRDKFPHKYWISCRSSC